MISLKSALTKNKDPDLYVINKHGNRFMGILGVYYQMLYDSMKWNCTFIDKTDIKKNASFDDEKYENDDLFFSDLINKNIVDFYFRPIPLEGKVIEKENVQISPIVDHTITRLLQCIHRKDDLNYLDVLTGLKDLTLDFWLKFCSIFILLSVILILVYFIRIDNRKKVRYQLDLRTKLNNLFTSLFLLYMRIITRQNNNSLIYNRLYFIRYLLLLVIMFTIIIHQVLFYSAFRELKFRNTSYILRDIQQLFQDPSLEPCFIESKTVIESKLADTDSITYKLYHHQKNVCFLHQVMSPKNKESGALGRLMRSILVGADVHVEYFGYLFCAKYSDFIRAALRRLFDKELKKDLPLFWYPMFRGDEIHQAFLISKKTSKQIQDEIYSKFTYRTYEHGWIKFLNKIRRKIDGDNSLNECFTDNYSRVSYPYRFSALIVSNFSIIFKFKFLHYFILIILFIFNWMIILFNQRIKIEWIKIYIKE